MEGQRRRPAIIGALRFVFLAFLLAVLMTPARRSSGPYAFSAAIFAAAALILFARRDGWMRERHGGAFWAASLGLTALFLAQISVTQLFANFAFSGRVAKLAVLFKPVYIAFLALAAYMAIGTALDFMLRERRVRADDGALRKVPVLGIYYAVLPVALVTVAYVLASYPSYGYLDIAGLLEHVRNGVWEEWHTVAFAMYCKLFSLWGRWQFCIYIFQGVFWIYICNYGVGVMHRLVGSRKVCVAYALVLAALFTPSLYCGFMLKDPVYCMCHYFLFTALFDFLSARERTAKHYIVLAFAAVVASVFRHAAFPPALCALIVLGVHLAKRARRSAAKLVALVLAVTLCVTFIGTVLPRNILHATENPPYVKYSVPMYMVGALSNKVADLDEEDIAVMEKVMPLERWRECSAADKYWADTVCRTWGGIGEDAKKLNDPAIGKDILLLNLRLLLKYPYQYLRSFFDISSILWEIARPGDGYEWAPLENGAIDYREGEGSLQHNVSALLTRSFSDLSFRNPATNPLYWRGGIWLFALIFAAVVLLCKRQYAYLIPLIVPLAATLLLFLSVPAQDPRYILYLIECGPFALFFAAFAPHRGADGRNADAGAADA